MFGSPLYSGRTVTADKNKGIKIMREALAEVEDVIVKHKGSFKVKNEVFTHCYSASCDRR
jgi:translation initiation factor 2 alpha subunit (eIF-2alpha)